jgi:glycosyltransferase involved in cell wall biosynthesis
VSQCLLVSVIIPAYQRTDLLRKSVSSALAQDFEPDKFEIVVVDSSPDDNNAKLVAELQRESRCSLRYFQKKPEGPGPSRNVGAKEARGAYFAFLDSDCQASPEWLRNGLEAFGDGVGLVQGRTIPDPRVPHGVFQRSLEVFRESCFYETANILYRREAFEQAGGFFADKKGSSEKWLIGGEDVDLAWRVKRAGWKSYFAERALVTHAVVPIPLWRWFFETRMSTVPLLVRGYPELRRFFYARYFFDRTQALLALALFGFLLTIFFPWGLVLVVPYVWERGLQPSRTLKGPLRLLRALLYFPRDLATMGALVVGSIRYRTLLL